MTLLMRLLTSVVGRVGSAVIDARRNLSGVCGPLVPCSFLTFIDFSLRFLEPWSIMMVGMVLLLILQYGLLVLSPRGVGWFHAVRDRAFLPGPPGIWDSHWVNVPASAISADDVAHWSFSAGLLVKWVSFLGSPSLACWWFGSWAGGISYVELLILYELWAGERLSLWRKLILVIFDQGVQFQCRLFLLVQALIFGVPVVSLVL